MKFSLSRIINSFLSNDKGKNDQYIPPSASKFELKNISLILGDKIVDIKMYYEPQGENDWLDSVITYITLERNGVINFPFSGDLHFVSTTLDKRAKSINEEAIPNIIGQTISDLYYNINDNRDPDSESLAFIQLSNNYVLYENRMAPHGTGAANLFLYTHDQFKEEFGDLECNLQSLKEILVTKSKQSG